MERFRCLSALAEKVTQTTAMEGKRVRKELQVLHSADCLIMITQPKVRIRMESCSMLVSF